MKSFATLLGALLLLVVVMFYSSFSWGYVLFLYRDWFIAPAFPTFPILSYTQCVGLMFVLALFRNHALNKYLYKDVEVKAEPNLWMFFLGPWVTLALANIIHVFVVK